MQKYGFFLFLLIFYSACKDGLENVSKKESYDGATIKAFDLKMQMSDSAKLRIEVTAPLQLEYKNGNQEYPKGVTVDFYNAQGKRYTRLTANKGKYDKTTHIYTVWNDVVVKNTDKGEQLNTEELNWSPTAQDIYTSQKVKITTPTEILNGYGLRAKQDFMTYKIDNPTGKFTVRQ
jgi:LPS export ABC transporter protein LptC